MKNVFLDGSTKSITKKEKINKDWKIYSWEANLQTEKILNTHDPNPVKNSNYLYILKKANESKE